jgi:hypothetical protein
LHQATEIFMLPAKSPQPRVQLDPHKLNLLRMLLAKLATTLGDPLRAYDLLRNSCRDASDDASLWTLFNCIASRTLINRCSHRTLPYLSMQHDLFPPPGIEPQLVPPL